MSFHNRIVSSYYLMDSYSVKTLWILYLSIYMWKLRNAMNCVCLQEEVHYGDTLEPSQLLCNAEMSPQNARFAWSYKVSFAVRGMSLSLTKSIDAVLQSYSTWLTLIFAVVVCLQNRLWERPYEVSLYFTNKCTSLEILLNLSLYCVGPQNLYPGAIFHTSNWQF